MTEAWLQEPGVVPYAAAYVAMHDLAARRAAGEIPDVLLLLEHPPTYTAGRRTDPSHLLMAGDEIERRGAELHEVDRGGSVTFHGPGQLVGYPIVDLRPGVDVLRYLRQLEEVVIRAAADLGVTLDRSERGDTGIWAGDRKVGAIGVRVSRGVTLHGFAVNCTTDLSWFDAIVPCGLADRGVASLSELAGSTITTGDLAARVRIRFQDVFGRRLVAAPRDVLAAVLTS